MKRKVTLYFMTVITLMLVLFEVVFSVSIYRYYYNGIVQYIESHAKASTRFFSEYNSLYFIRLQEYSGDIISSFQLDGTELQLIDRHGLVIQSSSGEKVEGKVNIPQSLLEGEMYNQVTTTKDNEKQLEVLSPLIHQGQTIGVLKYTTVLTHVNAKIIEIIMFTIAVGIVISCIVFSISRRLANSFVEPIESIIQASSQIAEGTLKNKIKEDYPGELGELAHSLNYMSDKIEKAEQMKNEFIASISHEIRTPLTGIKGWSETLKTVEHLTEEEIKQGMGIISGETDRLIHLVEELLDFSRLQSNHFNLYKQKAQLYDILEETIWQLTPNAEKKQIQFINTIERIELLGDRNRLKQIFLNIIQNAIKYSHENGTVYIEATKNEGQAVIKVKDEGIGIAKEHLPYIEQSFYQINNHAAGAGLGLAIVKKMVELHRGTLSIVSKEGIGTTILIKLPL
ncbi:HAMP domain-containing sensor histidine kinase [Bacillus toyonensis]|uniref:HAMP domain-containing sensor histidine kinase n=1 Tax=Bacillus toyonensis TaxID=155322 RepID=UPI000BF6DA33|nr:HAMP domain-containing sensor histidine kinase [Bacillus toyonensis]PGA05878.1 two-component sensor histidine kinase [Bacillus toyonensis]PGB38308.1 two-component sensor histidine kinase [Bacillus toyonensis]PGB99288.1 two-component sensor histidine kinase [Bacillus toyonensis]PGE36864.1 two-component sensor histidine kinase [Bacillus toyonensis]PHD02977.1 two-component sensor histidine kinase [Bacillus toyonensis]